MSDDKQTETALELLNLTAHELACQLIQVPGRARELRGTIDALTSSLEASSAEVQRLRVQLVSCRRSIHRLAGLLSKHVDPATPLGEMAAVLKEAMETP